MAHRPGQQQAGDQQQHRRDGRPVAAAEDRARERVRQPQEGADTAGHGNQAQGLAGGQRPAGSGGVHGVAGNAHRGHLNDDDAPQHPDAEADVLGKDREDQVAPGDRFSGRLPELRILGSPVVDPVTSHMRPGRGGLGRSGRLRRGRHCHAPTVKRDCYRAAWAQLRRRYVDMAAAPGRMSELCVPARIFTSYRQRMRNNWSMQATQAPLGLRERKKIKTRQAIRRAAFRLIEENGYAATTVEQIAEAAEVSPSTFFRYFPTKESVLLADDMDPAFLDALAAQPRDLSPLKAIRRAYQVTMGNMSEDEREFEDARQRLMFSIPELKAAMFDEYYRTITSIAEAIGARIGREAEDFELQVLAGALAGALMAAYNPGPDGADT